MPVLTPGEGKCFWVLGDLYTIKVSGEDTGGAYALIEATSRPHNGPPPHIHRREDEAFYILEGAFSFLYADRTIPAAAGSFVYVPRGTLHTFNYVGTSLGKSLVWVSPAGLEKFFQELGEPAPDTSAWPEPAPPDMEKLMRLCRKYEVEIRLPAA